MHLDDKLNWKCHINQICSKLNQLTGAFRHLADYIKPANAKQIYYAYVFPYIKYGIEVFGTCDPSIMKPLQTSQNKLLKILMKKERRFSTDHLHCNLKLLKCNDIHNFFLAIFVYKQQHNLLPKIFSKYFVKNSSIHNRETRGSNNLFVPRFRLKSSKKSIKYAGVVTWNPIPNDIKEVTSLKLFKRKYKDSLLSHYNLP
jgi:hypothetical protein